MGKRIVRTSLVLLTATLTTFGVASRARAQTTTFGAGSLIIPMDQCYNQSANASATYTAVDWSAGVCSTIAKPTCYAPAGATGDIRLPYGLLYLLAINHIPISVVNAPTKTKLTDPDITLTGNGLAKTATALRWSSNKYVADTTYLTCGTNTTMTYWGMPFVVDASAAAAAVDLIQRFNNNPAMYVSGNTTTFTPVPIHVANVAFTANVVGTLAQRPKPLLVSDTSFFDTFFTESGIPAVVGLNTSRIKPTETQAPSAGNGRVAQYSFTWPVGLSRPAGCAADPCTILTNGTNQTDRVVDIFWTNDDDAQFWNGPGGAKGMDDFFRAGGRVLMLSNGGSSGSPVDWETGGSGSRNYLGGAISLNGNSQKNGNYCPAAATGTNSSGVAGVAPDYPASDPYIQLGGLLMDPVGAGQNGGFVWTGSSVAANTHGLYGGAGPQYAIIAGNPVISGTQTPGKLIYAEASNSWNGAAGRKDSGLHIMYNTLVAGGGAGTTMQNIEFSRSTPVAFSPSQLYLGTIDWQVPANKDDLGTYLYRPLNSQYPYMTGHFREYKSSLVGTASLSCDPSVVGAPCSWDAAKLMKTFDNRNIYVAVKSGSTYTLKKASGAGADATLAADATIQYIKANIGTKLGAIDYGTPAVIENKSQGGVTVAGAQTRPTLAYVGARDGMLHAFCVTPEVGQNKCYGTFSPGEEVWAIIPASVKTQMDAARVAGDWSNVNIGGAARVADIVDTFGGGAAAPRTMLVVGTREAGSVVALDISNPNPSLLNQDGFKLLWENDGTNVTGGATAYTMKRTVGGSFSLNGTKGVVVVTGSAQGAGTNGINTYVMRAWDGAITASNQKIFSRFYSSGAGGALVPVPNQVPPLPTILDQDSDGFDETVLIADAEGQIRKLTFSGTWTMQSLSVLFDADTGCSANVACQPFGASPSVGRAGSSQALTAFIGSGGVDWARTPSQLSYAYGVDIATGTKIFQSSLGTVQPPMATGTVVDFPVRSYSQLSVAGTDLYAEVTELSLGDLNQLALSAVFPGTYGNVLRWSGMDNSLGAATQLISQGTNFAGGLGVVLEANTTTADGAITFVGVNGIQRTPLPAGSTSLKNLNQALKKAGAGGRAFTVQTWIDLNN